MINSPFPLTTPISDEAIRNLQIGDCVLLNGIIVTGRDAAHQWLFERFIAKTVQTTPQDALVYEQLKKYLQNGLIYHCGPIVSGLNSGDYRFVSAGPTTSIREEPYQSEIIRHFNLKGIIGKGGMGEKTLQACATTPCVYFHAIGGAAALIAQSVEQVLGVFKLEFGIPEALWVIQVKNFPVTVTMDAHRNSLHKTIQESSHNILKTLN